MKVKNKCIFATIFLECQQLDTSQILMTERSNVYVNFNLMFWFQNKHDSELLSQQLQPWANPQEEDDSDLGMDIETYFPHF